MLTAEKVNHCGNQKSGGRGHVEYYGDGAATYSERTQQNYLFL